MYTFPSLSDTIKEQFSIASFLYKEQNEMDDTFYLCETNYPCLLFPINGNLSLFSSAFTQKQFLLEKEQAILLPAHSGYDLHSTTSCSFFYLTFSGSLAHTLLTKALQHGNYINGNDYFFIQKDIKQIVSCLDTKESNQEELEILCFSLLTHLSNHTTDTSTLSYPPLVCAAISLMEENYMYLYGIEELATQLEVSKNHLIRLFQSSLKMSPLQYLTSIKMKHAKLLLASGEPSLELIAISCGFSGADYFRKVFKKETGISPKQYQSQQNTSITTSLPNELYL